MANLTILGVNHFDIQGPYKIRKILESLKDEGNYFDCVCIEWDEDIANLLIKNRSNFQEYIKQNNKCDISDEMIHLITQALAYEADEYKKVFKIDKVFWLDRGRKIVSIDEYMQGRLMIYIGNSQLYSIDINNPELVSRFLWDISLCEEEIGTDSEREGILKKGIDTTIQSGFKDILIIIGAKHAQITRKGSTAQLLDNEGNSIRCIILSPTLPPVDPTPLPTDV